MGVEILGVGPRAAVDRLRPNPKNDNKQSHFMFGKLLATLREEGFTLPIVVRSGDARGPFKDGLLEIVGGEQRWRAAQKLGMAEVPIVDIGCVSDLRTKKLLINLNRVHGDSDQDALSRLVREITEEGGESALESLPFDEDMLKDLLDGDFDPAGAAVEAGSSGSGDEDDSTTVDLGVGVTPRDLLAIFDLRGLSKAELTALLDAARLWSATRQDQAEPVWLSLQRLLEKNSRR